MTASAYQQNCLQYQVMERRQQQRLELQKWEECLRR